MLKSQHFYQKILSTFFPHNFPHEAFYILDLKCSDILSSLRYLMNTNDNYLTSTSLGSVIKECGTK